MASWFFHSLIYSIYIEQNNVPEEARAAFHLGCFAPDLVADRSQKKQTHYVFGLLNEFPIRYRIKRYQKEVRYSQLRDPVKTWFHRGYLLHLKTDAIWLKKCVHRMLPRFLLSSESWREAGRLYYEEMIAVDAFYRSKHLQYNTEAASIRLFADNQILDFFPDNLDQSKVNDVMELFSENKVNLTNEMNTRFIRERNVNEFLNMTSTVSFRDGSL